jgi:hypothetical protein
MNQLRKSLVFLASVSALLGMGPHARAQDHSWRWPLYVRDTSTNPPKTGQPRPAAWNSAGEYQEFGVTYLHPGHDLRGDYGDMVINPTASTLEGVFRYDDHCLNTGASCRLWFAANDNRYLYYVSHVDFADVPKAGGLEVTTEIREIVQNVAAGTATTPESKSIPAGAVVASLTNFPSSWHHLHLGIFDRQAGYQMVNTIAFLQQQATGANGESLLIVDDEKPTISSISLVKDGTETPAAVNGTCGPEVWGKVDVLADMYDTFYTTGAFADFPGKTTLNPNTGIRWADYAIRSVASGTEVERGTWFDINGVPLLCGSDTNLGCLLPSDPNPSLSGFLARMANELGAPSCGLSVLDKLFMTGPSKSDYAITGEEVYIHNLTNKLGVEGAWNTSQLANGIYQVTVEAEDFAFRRSAKSMFVTVHDPQTTLDVSAAGFGDVYVRDRDDDLGAVPSNAGGEPFWQSPDIFVVPKDVPVTETSFATQTAVQPDVDYDVWVRVKNAGCRDVTNVQAKVRSANPAAINTDWLNIGTGDYQGTPAEPGGVTVAAGSSKVIGPFRWKPSAIEASGDGHRCLLANITASGDALASSAEFDAPGSNNVAQRNMRVSGCDFQLPNPAAQNTELVLKLTTSAAVENDDTRIELVGPLIPGWYTAWASTPGAVLSNDGTRMRVRMRLRDITLPAVTILAGANYDFAFDIDLPQGAPNISVSIEATLLGAKSGFSCFAAGQKIPT